MKQLIKKILIRNTTIYNTIRKWYFRYNNLWWFDVLNLYLTHYKSQIDFIQIGCNDGKQSDEFFYYVIKNNWKGILVEPVPYIFNRLVNNYKDYKDNLHFENSAIATVSGIQKFYRLKESDLPNLPKWYDQIGSFKKEVILKHRDSVPNFDELFIEDNINAITFKELLKKYGTTKLNLLVIDTEGYDYEIIKMIPFAEIDIDLIIFEHKHLSVLEYKESKKLLKNNGFILHKKHEWDSVAIKKNILINIYSKHHHEN